MIGLHTGGAGSYGDANVVTLLSAFGSNSISTTGDITAGTFTGDGSDLTDVRAETIDSIG